MDANRFPNPDEARDNLNHARLFLVALVVLIAVTASFFYGSTWAFSSSDLTRGLSGTSANSLRLPSIATPAGAPTFAAATPVPPLAGVQFPDTLATGSRVTPAATTPAMAPSIKVLPTATGIALVANTGGAGVYLRHTPRLADRWVAWPDRTPMVLLGGVADADGTHWLQARDPSGDVGWLPAQFVQR